MANKKETKVPDLKPNKDAKGGGPGRHAPPPHESGVRPPVGPGQGSGVHPHGPGTGI